MCIVAARRSAAAADATAITAPRYTNTEYRVDGGFIDTQD
jgi:hypothetical protein